MQAIVQDRYGSAEVLEARDIEKPPDRGRPGPGRVHAASVHVGDWILMTGSPFVMRMATGLRKPKRPVPGTDIAGTVEAVGKDVTGFARATRCSVGAPAPSPSTHRASEDQLRGEAGQPHLRAGRGRRGVRDHRPPVPAR